MPYDDLLLTLIEQSTVTISINVSSSALRKGLAKAKDKYNGRRILLELPEEKRTVKIEAATSCNEYTVSLVNEVEAKFTTKFNFTIVSPKEVTDG